MFPAGDVNEWVSACMLTAYEKEGGKRGGHQGQSAKGDLKANIKRHSSSLMHVGVTPTQHGTTQTHQKHLPKPPSWPSSHWAIGRLWNPPTRPIDSSCCLVYHVWLSRRDGQRLQIELGSHGVVQTKLDSTPYQFVMSVLSGRMRTSPHYFFERRGGGCHFTHWYLSQFWYLTMVRYQYCFPILPAARGG